MGPLRLRCVPGQAYDSGTATDGQAERKSHQQADDRQIVLRGKRPSGQSSADWNDWPERTLSDTEVRMATSRWVPGRTAFSTGIGLFVAFMIQATPACQHRAAWEERTEQNGTCGAFITREATGAKMNRITRGQADNLEPPGT